MKRKLFKWLYTSIAAVTIGVLASPQGSVFAEEIPDLTDEVGEEEEKEPVVIDEGTYLDEHSIEYQWRAYDDGKTDIYGIEVHSDEEAITVDIPAVIEGHEVTTISGNIRNTTIDRLTIPEGIQYFTFLTFEYDTINNLYFNAIDAKNAENFFYTPFAYSTIHNLYVGDQVEIIEDYTFYRSEFEQTEVILSVPEVHRYAFDNASFHILTLTNDISYLETYAFEDAKMDYLCYNCPDTKNGATNTVTSPFYGADIYGLEFSDEIEYVPTYLFANADFKMKEFTVDVKRVGGAAFYHVWDTTGFTVGMDAVEKLTITDNVEQIGQLAFCQNYINELEYNTNATNNAVDTVTSPFYMAYIYGLSIGKNVEAIPDYTFSNTSFLFRDFEIDTSDIGKYAFYCVWEAYSGHIYSRNLHVTENVRHMGICAFASNALDHLVYESNATNDSTNTVNGPFYNAGIKQLTISENVTEIQPLLFANTDFTEPIDLEIDIPIGNYAFYTALGYNQEFGKLTIGENVSAMGKGAFHGRRIEELNYDAISALNANTKTGEAAFASCVVGSLQIGENVEKLGGATFCGITLTQDTIIIPDSVKQIGDYAFYNLNSYSPEMVVRKLVVGKGLRYMSYYAFGGMKFEEIYVESIEASDSFESSFSSSYNKYLPFSDDLYIHHDSPYFKVFFKNASNVHLYCDEYMESSVGATYYDEENNQYVTPAYEICSVCGYTITSYSYAEGMPIYSITIIYGNGMPDQVIQVREGQLLTQPENPDRDNYNFLDWFMDSDFTQVYDFSNGVYSDMAIYAGWEEVVLDEGEPDEGEPDEEEPDEEEPDEEETDEEEPDEEEPDEEEPDEEKPDEEEPDEEEPDEEEPDEEEPAEENPDEEEPDIEEPIEDNPIEDKPDDITPNPQEPEIEDPEPKEPEEDMIEDDEDDYPDDTPDDTLAKNDSDDSTPDKKDEEDDTPVIKHEPENKEPNDDTNVDKKEDTSHETEENPKEDVSNHEEEETSDTNEDDTEMDQEITPEESVIVEEPDDNISEISEKTDKRNPVLPIVLSVLLGTGGGGSAFLFFFYRRRKVRGHIADIDNHPCEDMRILFDDREFMTDQNGNFLIKGMSRGNHELWIFDSEDNVLLDLSIVTDQMKDEDTFTTLMNLVSKVDAHREGKEYFIDVML